MGWVSEMQREEHEITWRKGLKEGNQIQTLLLLLLLWIELSLVCELEY